MNSNSAIVDKAQEYVTSLMNGGLQPWAVYHNLQHTEETVEAVQEIGEGAKLGNDDMEVALLAAWFHDTGYVDSAENHEERSIAIAREFLLRHGYPAEKIERVAGCIRATKVPQSPTDVVEQVLCDADMIHMGKKRFFERSQLLRAEIELRTGKPFTDVEWLQKNIDFATKSQFFTEYARTQFAKRREKNLMLLQERLREALAGAEQKKNKQEPVRTKAEQKEEKLKRPERGIETMFRVVPKNHLDLTALADHKASILIGTTGTIMAITFSILVSKLDTHPHLTIPTLIVLTSCLATMIFAILATRPIVTSGTFTREDIQQRKVNLLFFGNFYRSTLEDFDWGMREMMKDSDYLYGSMIKDLYYLGKVLGTKYRYLRVAYTVFMWGLIASVLAFVIAMLATPAPVPFPSN
ncbi:MAG TPA: Pycsar system effector family protein [Bacteroidota bacterium]|nr:Pycsar system effector family protein [Bacteroidota bacterium]